MSATVTIGRRFNGPPDYGHGGYSCGAIAAEVEARVASVSLRRPPPLDTPLEVRRGEGGSVAVLDGEDVVGEGAPGQLSLAVPPPVSVEAARMARTRAAWAETHPFPTCFGCGTERDRAEAIATILGPVEGRDGIVADTWTPQAEFADADGRVTPLFAWAALDCATGAGAIPLGSAPHVLARLTVDPALAPVRAGAEHVVMAWAGAVDGRKRTGAAALLTAGGEVCAIGEGLWIALRDPATHGARV
ncbi:MAG: hypothetical protein QOE65_865 [Solirubrobacteraceae bacterium]|jgi:hypothetical protein|nr:hypothetical protein [Solirubrobacteraceae bacterium]